MQKIKAFIDEGYQFTDDPVVTEHLKQRVSIISGHIKERNRLMHSMWFRSDKGGEFLEGWQERRHRDSIQLVQAIEHTERFADKLEWECSVSELISDLILHHRVPNLVEILERMIQEARSQEQ